MNTLGSLLRVSVCGESHGPALLATLDGVPVGLTLSPESFTEAMARRQGEGEFVTPRREADRVEIVAGVFNGHTTGAPLALFIANRDARSSDYTRFAQHPRPGHSDMVARLRYEGFNDPRGGGIFSGRLTAGMVAAGVVAKMILSPATLHAKLVQIGPSKQADAWHSLLRAASARGDSLGGIVELRGEGFPLGVGEPPFDGVEPYIARALMAIPGARGVEFGAGFAGAAMKGSEHNDCYVDAQGHTASNYAGGANGGLTNGNELVARVAFKPTPSIAQAQVTFNLARGAMEPLRIHGRHDVCFALRTPVIVESYAALALADLTLRHRARGMRP